MMLTASIAVSVMFITVGLMPDQSSNSPYVEAQSIEELASCGDSPLDGRTQKVVDAIVGAAASVSTCEEVTDQHLPNITMLDLSNKGLMSLESSDFDGLPNLQTLLLNNNQLVWLPEDIFSGLPALQKLTLYQNQLTYLPENIFNGLSNLQWMELHQNQIESLDTNVFNGLSSLQVLYLRSNQLTSLDADVFSGLSSLQWLELWDNPMQEILTPSHFQSLGLDNLNKLWLGAEPASQEELAAYQAVLPSLNDFRAGRPDGVISEFDQDLVSDVNYEDQQQSPDIQLPATDSQYDGPSASQWAVMAGAVLVVVALVVVLGIIRHRNQRKMRELQTTNIN